MSEANRTSMKQMFSHRKQKCALPQGISQRHSSAPAFIERLSPHRAFSPSSTRFHRETSPPLLALRTPPALFHQGMHAALFSPRHPPSPPSPSRITRASFFTERCDLLCFRFALCSTTGHSFMRKAETALYQCHFFNE